MAIPICGPKCSMCCLLLSVWGVVMLVLMGIFLKVRSPAFVEDLPIKMADWEESGYSPKYIENMYDQVAINCFIAAGLYGGTLVISAVMWKVNQRNDYTMS